MKSEDLKTGDRVEVNYRDTSLTGTIVEMRWFGNVGIQIDSGQGHWLSGKELVCHSRDVTRKV